MSIRMSLRSVALRLPILLSACVAILALTSSTVVAAPNTSPPSTTVKYVFVHHSTGQAWLTDGYGNLGANLSTNNYFVSDTNYGWGPDGIGNNTDVGDWWTWFRGSSASTYTAALYANTGQNSPYARSLSDPGGENTIIMFKSCFPNSNVGGSPSDAVPPIGSNPLAGNGMSNLTVGNAKGVYLDLLEYFKLHTDKMFVLVVSPPLRSGDTNATYAANARALANWLVDRNGLLKDYTAGNVFVYDYYTVLTGGHHRISGGTVQHSTGPTNYLAYPTGDSHPSAAGDQIATAEFVPLLNAAYNSWKAGTGAMLYPDTPAPSPEPSITKRKCTLTRPSAGHGNRLSRKYKYRWHGRLWPAQIGTSSIRLQIHRRVHGRWRKYVYLSVKIPNHATYWWKRLRITRRGSFRIRVKHADTDHRLGYSGYRYFTVR